MNPDAPPDRPSKKPAAHRGTARYAPAVDSAMALVSLLASANGAMTLSEIAAKLALAPASCYRILNSLLAVQIIARDPHRKRAYCLGSGIFQLASTTYQRQIVLPHFHSVAEVLKNETQQTVLLQIGVGNKTLVVAKTEIHPVTPLPIHIGHTLPMHLAAAGKAILATHSIAFLQSYLEFELKPALPEHISALRNELEQIRRLGYSTTQGEIDPRLSCVAAPVLNLNNEAIAAISLCAPRETLPDPLCRHYAAALIQAARQLSARVG